VNPIIILMPSGRFLLNTRGEKVIELHDASRAWITRRDLIRAAAGAPPESGNAYISTGPHIREAATNRIVASVAAENIDADELAAALADNATDLTTIAVTKI